VHLQDDDLRFYLLGRLPGDRVAAIDSHLQDCKECGGRLVEAVRFVSQLARSDTTAAVVSREQRGAPRFVTQDTVGVQPLNPFSSESVQASLENVSRGGMRLRTATMLGTGTLIKLHLRSAIMFGEVRYCESSGNNFFIGVQFSDAV
jgi:anti-sigma factor RsiW